MNWQKSTKKKPSQKKKWPSKTKLNKKNCELAKLIAKARDRYICQHCGRTSNIHGSHIINEARDHRLACDPYNIKALCYNCHFWWRHKNPVEAGDWFRAKRPGRREKLQAQHIANQDKWTIQLSWVIEQHINLVNQAKTMGIKWYDRFVEKSLDFTQ